MAASTLLDILEGSLTAIGQLGQGQTMNASDAARGLRLANLLLGKHSTKRLFLSSVAQRQYALSANTADYTIGTSGNPSFNAVRPTFIEAAQVKVPGSVDYWTPLGILDKTKWDGIRNRSARAETPDDIYVEYTYPNLAFHVHPAPSGTPMIRLGCWEPLTRFVTVDDPADFPDPYEEFFESNIAVLYAPYYDQPVPKNLLDRAADAAVSVMQFNAQAMGGALGEAQKLDSPNVGQPQPGGTG